MDRSSWNRNSQLRLPTGRQLESGNRAEKWHRAGKRAKLAACHHHLEIAVVAVAVSVLTALLGGLLPALKAAKLEPALALR